MAIELDALQSRLRAFRDERDWEQFHSPKNLTAAIAVEAAELQELFLWIDSAQSRAFADENREAVEEELADVFIQCLNLADTLGVDLLKASARKIDLNEKRYPVDKARGSAAKYDEL